MRTLIRCISLFVLGVVLLVAAFASAQPASQPASAPVVTLPYFLAWCQAHWGVIAVVLLIFLPALVAYCQNPESVPQCSRNTWRGNPAI